MFGMVVTLFLVTSILMECMEHFDSLIVYIAIEIIPLFMFEVTCYPLCNV